MRRRRCCRTPPGRRRLPEEQPTRSKARASLGIPSARSLARSTRNVVGNRREHLADFARLQGPERRGRDDRRLSTAEMPAGGRRRNVRGSSNKASISAWPGSRRTSRDPVVPSSTRQDEAARSHAGGRNDGGCRGGHQRGRRRTRPGNDPTFEAFGPEPIAEIVVRGRSRTSVPDRAGADRAERRPEVLRDRARGAGEEVAVLVQQQRAAGRNQKRRKLQRPPEGSPVQGATLSATQRGQALRCAAKSSESPAAPRRNALTQRRRFRRWVPSSRRAKPGRRARPPGRAARRDDNPPRCARTQAPP